MGAGCKSPTQTGEQTPIHLPVLTASSDQLVDPGHSLLTLPLPFVYSLSYEGTELEMTREILDPGMFEVFLVSI